MKDPTLVAPARHELVRVLFDGRWTAAYRVDYRKAVAFPDYVDPDTGDGWRFCTRIVGLGRLAQDRVTGWDFGDSEKKQ